MQQREAELQAAQSLVREKDEALSQEQQRSSQERGELRGQLAEKVRPASTTPLLWGRSPLCCGRVSRLCSEPGTPFLLRQCSPKGSPRCTARSPRPPAVLCGLLTVASCMGTKRQVGLQLKAVLS